MLRKVTVTGENSKSMIFAIQVTNFRFFAQRWRFGNDRLRSTLGFVPKFTLRQMLQAVVTL